MPTAASTARYVYYRSGAQVGRAAKELVLTPPHNALRHIENIGDFRPYDRVYWIEARKLVEQWPDRDKHPALDDAFRAVADMPEHLPDEAARWDEFRHQLEVVCWG